MAANAPNSLLERDYVEFGEQPYFDLTLTLLRSVCNRNIPEELAALAG